MSPDQLVQRGLYLSCALKGDAIAVAGPDGLEAMLSLCRAGFDHVECARQATCAGADEACDLLLIVGPTTADTLADTVRRTARLLRDGGRLIAEVADRQAEGIIEPSLAAAGLRSHGLVADQSTCRLVVHTVTHIRPPRRTG